jgi:hypothetical protein
MRLPSSCVFSQPLLRGRFFALFSFVTGFPRGFWLALLGGLILGALPAAATVPATTTTLALTAAGAPPTTVEAGSAVTLTATVKAAGTAITTGQVNFCDAAAAYCSDIHMLGTAQLTKAGTATFKFRPGIGDHAYNAIFAGTAKDASSTSGTVALAVTGTQTSTTTIAQIAARETTYLPQRWAEQPARRLQERSHFLTLEMGIRWWRRQFWVPIQDSAC